MLDVAGWPSWKQFASVAPDLAAFGRERLVATIAYLGTVRDMALPRVHPVQPIISEERLLLFMYPSSPKARDLGRDGRYALHSTVVDASGSNGEFLVRGRARLVADPVIRGEATEAGYEPKDQYILFELSVEQALANEYDNGLPNYRRWSVETG